MQKTRIAVAGVFLILGAAGCASMKPGMGPSAPMVQSMVAGWPTTSRDVAAWAMQKYGAPNEATATMLVWHNNGPWKRTIVYRDEVPHAFPGPHPDVMQQFIDYRVPLDRYDEMAMYDGSVVVERTNGEMSARCDKEEANFLALNLANDIATGRRTVEDARAMYAREIMAFKQGQGGPYTKGLQFSVPRGGTADPDRPAM